MSSGKCIHLCNSHPDQEYNSTFLSCKKALFCPLAVNFYSSFPSLQYNQSLFWFLSLSISFAYSSTSYQHNHWVCTCLCLASLAQHNVFKIHSCCSMYKQFIHFYCWLVFHHVNIPHLFIQSSVNRHLYGFQFSVIMNKKGCKWS